MSSGTTAGSRSTATSGCTGARAAPGAPSSSAPFPRTTGRRRTGTRRPLPSSCCAVAHQEVMDAFDANLRPLGAGVDVAGRNLGFHADVDIDRQAVQIVVEGNEALSRQDALRALVQRRVVELDVWEQLGV